MLSTHHYHHNRCLSRHHNREPTAEGRTPSQAALFCASWSHPTSISSLISSLHPILCCLVPYLTNSKQCSKGCTALSFICHVILCHSGHPLLMASSFCWQHGRSIALTADESAKRHSIWKGITIKWRPMFPRRNACPIAHHWFYHETFIQLALHTQRMISGRQWRSVSSGPLVRSAEATHSFRCTPWNWWDGLQTASPFPWNQHRYTNWPAVLRVTFSGKCFSPTLHSSTTQWRIKFAPIAPVHFVIAPTIARDASVYCVLRVSTTQLQSLTAMLWIVRAMMPRLAPHNGTSLFGSSCEIRALERAYKTRTKSGTPRQLEPTRLVHLARLHGKVHFSKPLHPRHWHNCTFHSNGKGVTP